MENTPHLSGGLVELLGQPGQWRDGRHRTVPLVWQVLEHGSRSVASEAYEAPLEAVPPLSPGASLAGMSRGSLPHEAS
jgi:hypothetical protein